MDTFIIGFGGVLVGALLAGLVKTWSQVIEARSAANIIRMEIQDNMQRAVLALTNSRTDIKLRDDSWKGHRVQLVPLLPNQALSHMSNTYGACWIIEDWISRCVQKPAEAKREVDTWIENSGVNAALLRQICDRARIAQVFDILLSKPTFPKRPQGGENVEQQLKELREKVFEAAANKRDSARQEEQST